MVIPLGALVAGIFGVLLGAPTLKLRGDYLAIVTLGFGEIIRMFLNNLDAPVNITNGPQGIDTHRPDHDLRRRASARRSTLFGLEFPTVTQLLLPVPAAGRCSR